MAKIIYRPYTAANGNPVVKMPTPASPIAAAQINIDIRVGNRRVLSHRANGLRANPERMTGAARVLAVGSPNPYCSMNITGKSAVKENRSM